VSSYPQLTVRLPAETRAKLNTLSLLLGMPIWRIIDQSIEVYVQNLPAEDRKILGSLVDRLARGDWPTTSHWAVAWQKPGGAQPAPPAKPRTRRPRSA
jgi:predicted DNA-binding protein